MEPFKNLFSPELVRCIGQHLQSHLPGFDRTMFERSILAELEKLELKQRSQLIADHMHAVLPAAHSERHPAQINRVVNSLCYP